MEKNILRAFLRGEEGATAIEYALLVALLGLAIAPTLLGLGDNMNDTFDQTSTNLGG